MLRQWLNHIARGLVAFGGGISPWLNDQDNPFLFTLHLKGVTNPFEGDALWDSQYGGGPTIREARTGRGDHRLRLALDAHRLVVPIHDEVRGYLVEDPRVYTDVLLRIPGKLFRQQNMADSGHFPILLDKLAHRHNQEFQDQLFGGRAPRYQVIPEEDLEDDEVLCQFGLGVFIPDAEDRRRGKVSVRLDDKEHDLPDWETFQIGRGPIRRITHSAALYHDQHYLLLANDRAQAPIRSPHWPQGAAGYLLVNLAGERPELEPEEGPLRAAGVRREGTGNAWCCRFETEDTRALEVMIRLDAPEDPAASTDPASGTIVFTGWPAPLLVLAGIALPRIEPSLPPRPAEWTLRLDPQGLPASNGAPGATLKGKVGETDLYLRPAGARQFRPCPLPAEALAAGSGCDPLTIDLLPEPLTNYFGVLRPAHTRKFPIPGAKADGVVIGRDPAADKTKESAIPLTLLNQPGSLLWDDNTHRNTLNILVSGRFARLFPQGNTLRVEQLSKSLPLHHLDKSGQWLCTLAPNSQDKTTLEDGEQLLLGLYLLRYQAAKS